MYSQKNVKVFISYRNVTLSTHEAEALARWLSQARGNEVFLDQDKLRAGDVWEKKIYENIRDSDVLIVLLEPDTADSEWVQREVDVARGANVSILPVQIQRNLDISNVQKKLAISDTQYLQFSSSSDEDFARVAERIEVLSKQTRDAQKDWMKNLEFRRRVQQARTELYVRSFVVPQLDDVDCRIHLTLGDMSKLTGVDVLVNSENDYMQMARIYESNTLSSVLRREGAHIVGGRMKQDTVQQELYERIMASDQHSDFPLQPGQVVPTTAGHEKSKLVHNGVRYIFHAATVRVDAISTRERVRPIDTDEGIHMATCNVLEKVLEVNHFGGLPQFSYGFQQPHPYDPIRSIVFPVFGTGRGGRSVLEVAPPMIYAFQDFLFDYRADPEMTLTDIHLCLLSETDRPYVEQALMQILEPTNERP